MTKKTTGGFTFIELVVVISVLGILAFMSLPRLTGAMNAHVLEMASQNLVSDIRLVQQLNINSAGLPPAERCTLHFALDDSGKYFYFIRQGSATIKTVYLPPTVTWRIMPSSISFNDLGLPVGASQTIRLYSPQSDSLFVIIAASTGRARISSNNETDK